MAAFNMTGLESLVSRPRASRSESLKEFDGPSHALATKTTTALKPTLKAPTLATRPCPAWDLPRFDRSGPMSRWPLMTGLDRAIRWHDSTMRTDSMNYVNQVAANCHHAPIHPVARDRSCLPAVGRALGRRRHLAASWADATDDENHGLAACSRYARRSTAQGQGQSQPTQQH